MTNSRQQRRRVMRSPTSNLKRGRCERALLSTFLSTCVKRLSATSSMVRRSVTFFSRFCRTILWMRSDVPTKSTALVCSSGHASSLPTHQQSATVPRRTSRDGRQREATMDDILRQLRERQVVIQERIIELNRQLNGLNQAVTILEDAFELQPMGKLPRIVLPQEPEGR